MGDNPGPTRVLIVDDERHIARFLEFVLTKNGYQVKVAYDGVSAIALLDAFRPEAIVLDLVLPHMSGMDVLAAIRAHPDCSESGVVVLSAHTFELGGETLDPMGRTVQCAKPIAPSRLLEKLKEFGLPARIDCGVP
jgi:two-component system alkaline phosphatase synthesis response regulator PhoP